MTKSKVTSQGQISIPSEVRSKLGIGPGSTLEWHEEGSRVFLQRLGAYSSEDIHNALFSGRPAEPKTLEQLKDSVRQHALRKFAGA